MSIQLRPLKTGDWFYWKLYDREMVAEVTQVDRENYHYTVHYHNRETCPYKVIKMQIGFATSKDVQVRLLTPEEIKKAKLESL